MHRESLSEGRNYWDAVSKHYDEFYAHRYSQREDREVQKRLVEAIGQCDKPRILDIGCGTGLGLKLLMTELKEFSYVGMDISEGMISQFRSKVGPMPQGINVDLRVADARYIDQLFPSGS